MATAGTNSTPIATNNNIPSDNEVLLASTSGVIGCLQLNLYDDGYSLSLPGKDGDNVETEPFAYVQSELLDCVVSRQVPFFLVDLLEQCTKPLFYKNCLAVTINDQRAYRQNVSGVTGTDSVSSLVLRPTALSLNTDLQRLMQLHDFTDSERAELEAHFLSLAAGCSIDGATATDVSQSSDETTQPQCSDSPATAEPLQTYDLLFSRLNRQHHPVRSYRHRIDNVQAMNRSMPILPPHPCVSVLVDPDRMVENTLRALRSHKQAQTTITMPHTKAPDEIAGRRHAVVQHKRAERERHLRESGHEMGDLQLIEEIVVIMPLGGAENDATTSGEHATQICISRHRYDDSYWGRLVLDGQPSPVENGPFRLGSEWDAKMYVLQYLEMITEGGRKQPIKVTRTSPGRLPHVVSLKSFK